MNVSISAKELDVLLDCTPSNQNLMLEGKHGIGKSEILTQHFSEKGMEVVTLFLGQMSDPGDLLGLPTRNAETGKTDFMPPYWFPTDGKPIVLFLDELNRARPEVLQTVMDLTLNRRLAGRELPKGSRLIAAVNDGEEYQLTDLDPALVSRFNIYTFRPTVEEWLLWAARNGVDERVINFINSNPTSLEDSDDAVDSGLDKTPDRRSWKHVSDVIKTIPEIEDSHKKLIAGIVGLKAANLFVKEAAARNTLSGREVLLDFSICKGKVSRLQLHELSALNDSVFRFLETGDYDEQEDAVADGLKSYTTFLLDSKKSEAFAHWVSLFSSGNYPRATLLVLTKTPQLYSQIQNFINLL